MKLFLFLATLTGFFFEPSWGASTTNSIPQERGNGSRLLTMSDIKRVRSDVESDVNKDVVRKGFFGDGENRLHGLLGQANQHIYGHELHPTLGEKSYVYARGIAQGHFFTDGNKRTASKATELFLNHNNVTVTDQNTLHNIVNMTLPNEHNEHEEQDETAIKSNFISSLHNITNPRVPLVNFEEELESPRAAHSPSLEE
jgi:death-on-curing protein